MKAGQKVQITDKYSSRYGQIGRIVRIIKGADRPFEVDMGDDTRFYRKVDIQKVPKVKFDLPRKRKKACQKAIGRANYIGVRMVNQLLFDDNGRKPKYTQYNNVAPWNPIKNF
jgi:hypothetical protein